MHATISSQISKRCVVSESDGGGVQLCVMSIGFDTEGVAADMIHHYAGAASLPSLNACISCVVLPDGTADAVLERVARALSSTFSRCVGQKGSGDAVVNVHHVAEGTQPRMRCAYYQAGGVIVLCSRALCADLLHRRVARELIGCCVLLLHRQRVDAIAHTAGFCEEILLRGGSSSLLPGGRKHPPIFLLSDDPCFVRYAVQHQCNRQEPFLTRMRVENILLFPRFSLDIVKHFEKLKDQRPLMVERVTVSMGKSVAALDALLCKVIEEIVGELHDLHERLGLSRISQRHDGGESASDQAEELRSGGGGLRPRCDAGNNAKCSPQDSFSQRQRWEGYRKKRGSNFPPRYTRKPWSSAGDDTVIDFCGVSYADAIDIMSQSLEDDLKYALRTHGAGWPYAKLCESLLDLRRLRRAVRYYSPYDAVLILENVLVERTPRLMGQPVMAGHGAVQPPDAPWILSQHYNAITSLFVYRLGEVREVVGDVELSELRPLRTYFNVDEDSVSAREVSEGNCGTGSVIYVDDDDDDNDDDVVCVSHVVRKQLLFPRPDEVDTRMELTTRLVLSWGRDMHRKHVSRSLSSKAEGAPAMRPQLLVVVVVGGARFQRYVRRLTHSLEDFQMQELSRFLMQYQRRHGVDVQPASQTAQQEASVSSKLRTRFLPQVVDSDSDCDEGDNIGDGSDVDVQGQGPRSMPASVSQGPSFLFSEGCCPASGDCSNGQVARNASGHGIGQGGRTGRPREGGATSLYHILLNQQQVIPRTQCSQGRKQKENTEDDTVEVSAATEEGKVFLQGERYGDGVTQLSFRLRDSTSVLALPLHVAVVDGASLCLSSLVDIVKGTHGSLSFGTGDPKCEATCPVRTSRIIVTEQHLHFLRLLEMAQDVLAPQATKGLRIQILEEQREESSSLSDSSAANNASSVCHLVNEEREAFQALAHAKATLAGTLIADRASVSAVQQRLDSAVLDEGRNGVGRRAALSSMNAMAGRIPPGNAAVGCSGVTGTPLVIFDEREFRCRLPYELYCRGIDIVPLTLSTADYVLSPSYALERKSVGDFISSLCSGRIRTQLGHLSRSYEHPMCLIEFDRGAPFRLSFSLSSASREVSEGSLYSRMARLFAAYPRVHVLWTRDAMQSAAVIHTLKRTCATESVDPSTPSLTGACFDPNDESRTKEASHSAARVLSCFPGITASNMPRVMALCGSLAGLATIEEEALASAMGSSAAKELYEFLHGDSV